MTTTTKEKPITHWATEAGARVAARRAERQAEREAEAELTTIRDRLTVDVLAKRFSEVARLVIELVDAFASAAGIVLEADGVSSSSIQLKGPAALDTLLLRRDDASLIVTFRSRSRGDERPISLDVEDFSPEAIARTIAEQFIRQLTASEEGGD